MLKQLDINNYRITPGSKLYLHIPSSEVVQIDYEDETVNIKLSEPLETKGYFFLDRFGLKRKLHRVSKIPAKFIYIEEIE
jgi:hypothetical protein